MGFMNTINIVGSGLTAQQLRLDIVAENVTIGENAVVGAMPTESENGVATVGADVSIGDNAKVGPNAMVRNNVEGGGEEW